MSTQLKVHPFSKLWFSDVVINLHPLQRGAAFPKRSGLNLPTASYVGDGVVYRYGTDDFAVSTDMTATCGVGGVGSAYGNKTAVAYNVEAQRRALCGTSTDMGVLANAAGALANLALDESSRAQIVAEGAAPPLVQLCAKSKDNMVLGNAAQALVNLARHEAARAQLVQDGVVTRLGSNDPVDLDVRFVAASKQDLEAAAARGDAERASGEAVEEVRAAAAEQLERLAAELERAEAEAEAAHAREAVLATKLRVADAAAADARREAAETTAAAREEVGEAARAASAKVREALVNNRIDPTALRSGE